MRWIQARDAAGRVLALPNQKPGLLERYGLAQAEADREAWTIDLAGEKLAGAAAINRCLQELPQPWPWVAGWYRLPLLRWVEDRGYRWVAEHRHWLARWYSTVPECDRPDSECK